MSPSLYRIAAHPLDQWTFAPGLEPDLLLPVAGHRHQVQDRLLDRKRKRLSLALKAGGRVDAGTFVGMQRPVPACCNKVCR